MSIVTTIAGAAVGYPPCRLREWVQDGSRTPPHCTVTQTEGVGYGDTVLGAGMGASPTKSGLRLPKRPDTSAPRPIVAEIQIEA
jgi:hypothetical protein